MQSQTIVTHLSVLGGLCPATGESFLPLQADDLTAMESKIGSTLPQDYRSFVAEYGGGVFCQSVRCHIDSTQFIYPGWFYGGGSDNTSVFNIHWAFQVYEGRMPGTLIPIQDCGAEGLICLGVDGPEYSKVYFWDRDHEWASEEEDLLRQGKPVPSTLQFRNLTLLADSFTHYLLRLSLDDD